MVGEGVDRVGYGLGVVWEGMGWLGRGGEGWEGLGWLRVVWEGGESATIVAYLFLEHTP